MTLNEQVVPNGPTLFLGDVAAIEQVKDKGVRVAFAINIDFMHIVIVGDEFRTYGPVGGNNTPYHVIDWAYRNTPAFGVGIETTAGINCPVCARWEKT